MRASLIGLCVIAIFAGVVLLATGSVYGQGGSPGAPATGDAFPGKSPASTGAGPSGVKRMYWGAWIGKQLVGQEAPWDMVAVDAFEKLIGKRPSLIQFGSPFADCRSGRCEFYVFPARAFEAVRRYGAIPFYSWASYAVPMRPTQEQFRLRDIQQGVYDAYIRSWATAAKKWGHPFFLRFDWEMNGRWFPWSDLSNNNRRGDFVAAWRHVHDIFTSVGANNVTWVWCPNADFARSGQPLDQVYPGDAYVDWTCLDGYNRNSPWKSFDQIFRSSYEQLVTSIAPSKPVVIAETASTEKGGSKPAWIADLLTTQLPWLYPQVGAVLWFEKFDSRFDWPIESSAASRASFSLAIRTPAYAANDFRTLAGGPIEALPRR